ncbi:hypothetical protein B0H11DRAFT_1912912 [Mycena galericulata]|nr:hypothetical protein B0H11DRAFT_1920841 [Mycena galericulata]KAJ7488765.1 hypothetical protein B0H11DRAFT_1912912 [Mycena galericulata]
MLNFGSTEVDDACVAGSRIQLDGVGPQRLGLEETRIIVGVFGNEGGDMGKKIGAHRLALHVHQRRTRNVDPFVVEKPDRVRYNAIKEWSAAECFDAILTRFSTRRRRWHVGGTVVVRGRKWGGGGQHVAVPEPTAWQRWRILKPESAASGSRGGTLI